jgi:DnaJ-domain-containing protein 1
MRMILIGIVIVSILFIFWSLRAPIVREKRRRRVKRKGEPERIERCIETLGLKSGASQEEINQAYRDLVTVWHPDRFANNLRLQKKAEENLKEINAAYEYIRSFHGWK